MTHIIATTGQLQLISNPAARRHQVLDTGAVVFESPALAPAQADYEARGGRMPEPAVLSRAEERKLVAAQSVGKVRSRAPWGSFNG